MIIHNSIPRTTVEQEADELVKKADLLLNWTDDNRKIEYNHQHDTTKDVQIIVPVDENSSTNNNNTTNHEITIENKIDNSAEGHNNMNDTQDQIAENNNNTYAIMNNTSEENTLVKEDSIVPANQAIDNIDSSSTTNTEPVVHPPLVIETNDDTTTTTNTHVPSPSKVSEDIPVSTSLFVSPATLLHKTSSPSIITTIRPQSQGFPVNTSRLLTPTSSFHVHHSSPLHTSNNNSATATTNDNNNGEFLINPFSDALPSSNRPSTVPHGYSPRNSNRRIGDTSPLRSTPHKASQNVAPYRAAVTNS